MMARLSHRGPDGGGLWLSDSEDVALGHKRLAIIDLSASADQPMASADGNVQITFNGEIYNHEDLREELTGAGACFRTASSDTEVLINGYQVWGLEGLLEKLIGMFAFAIVDSRRNLMHLVRDRVGIKPLSILRLNDRIYFASEIKAFLEVSGFRPELDRENLYHHLSFRSLPAPRSLFKRVEKVRPGEIVTFDLKSGEERRTIYWSPLAGPQTGPDDRAQAVSGLRELLDNAISYRLVSDVPVGLFLSGGVDSAYVLSRISEGGRSINTFTVSFPENREYCEQGEADALAERFGSTHSVIPVHEGDYANLLPKVAYFQDEPISAPICVPVYLLSHDAKEHGVKVVLSGEGSDELFVGYESWAKVLRLEGALRKFPAWMRRFSATAACSVLKPIISPSSRSIEILERAAKGRPLFWGGAMDFCENEKPGLFQEGFLPEFPDTYEAVIAPLRREFTASCDPEDVTAWMSFLDLRFRLPELMLPRVDKMGMASSVEGRVPFLDHRLIEFYFSLPQSLREQSAREGKGLFKQIAAEKLGHDFVYRKKRGFQAPVKQWKNGPFGDLYNPLLIEFAKQTSIFDPAAVEKLLARSDDRLYFGLINLMLWYVNYIEDVFPEENFRFQG